MVIRDAMANDTAVNRDKADAALALREEGVARSHPGPAVQLSRRTACWQC